MTLHIVDAHSRRQAVTPLGLAAVSAWFASERWIFVQHKGQKWQWLEEVISEVTNSLENTRVARASRMSLRWCSVRVAAARGILRHLTSWIIKPRRPKELLPIIVETARLLYPQEPAPYVPKSGAALSVYLIATENPASTYRGTVG